MSFEDGWAAIHLEMPKRVPRTEYSVTEHWELVRVVTGLDVDGSSPPQERRRAQVAFEKAWNFGFLWGTHIGRQEFGDLCTDMGHAEYAAGGVDRRDTIHCPFKTPEEVLDFDPWQAYGRKDGDEMTRRFNEIHRAQSEQNPHAVTMVGIYVTLMSGLIDIFGWEMLLLAAGTDPKRFGELANRYASWIAQYFQALARSQSPVVMVHDDIVWTSGAFLHPEWYRRYVFANYRKLFDPLRRAGKRIFYTSDGNYTEFLDDVVDAGAHGCVMEPSTDMAYFAEKYGRTHFFVGNADTRILLRGSKADIRAEVERCMGIGKGCPGFFLAVGNHIPANTPVEAALYYNRCYEEMGPR